MSQEQNKRFWNRTDFRSCVSSCINSKANTAKESRLILNMLIFDRNHLTVLSLRTIKPQAMCVHAVVGLYCGTHWKPDVRD